MPTFREQVVGALERSDAELAAYALRWREYRDDTPVSLAVQYATTLGRPDDVHNTLTDPLFRRLRVEFHGAAAYRDDLHRGTEYFSSTHPDLLRYLRVSAQQRLPERDDDYAVQHRRHCRAFENFLQLDTPARDRGPTGIHRVLTSLFPMTLPTPGDAAVLHGYKLGRWSCACGTRRGHAARYDYTCSCGTRSGNGVLPSHRRRCRRCDERAEYVLCERCATRVTLDVWQQIQAGGLHPAACEVPLELELTVRRRGQPKSPLTLHLMQVPLLLGLTERDGTLIFDLPDTMWVNDPYFRPGRLRATGQLVTIADQPRYRRQTDVTTILETALLRALTERGQPTGSALQNAVLAAVGLAPKARTPRTAAWFTNRFHRTVAAALSGNEPTADALSRGADLSLPCRVSISPALTRGAALLSNALREPGILAGPATIVLSRTLRTDLLGNDELTSSPPGIPADKCRALTADGLVRAGGQVEPGDVLAGISRPVPRSEIVLLDLLVFKDPLRSNMRRRDASLYWEGDTAARVIHVETGAKPGRGQPRMANGATVSVTLTTTASVQTGDILRAPDDTAAVVCGFHDDATTDILVGPAHPWATSTGGRVSVRLLPDDLVHAVSRAHSAGNYDTTRQLPYGPDDRDTGAQLYLGDITWLLQRGARRAATELYACRTDGIRGRRALHQTLIGERADTDNAGDSVLAAAEPATLLDAPAEVTRNWGRLLYGAAVNATCDGDGLRFQPVDDAQVPVASSGVVMNSKSINERTGKTEKFGLFCESIFGPVRDYTCWCGRYRDAAHARTTCDRCQVDVTDSAVRRTRFGHVDLAHTMVHPWFHSALSPDLGLAPEVLADIILHRLGVDPDSGLTLPVQSGAGDEDRLLTGADALRSLYARQGADPPRGCLLNRVLVVPPTVRDLAQHDGKWRWHRINRHYQEVIEANLHLNRLRDIFADHLQGTLPRGPLGRLQAAVNNLLGTHTTGSAADLSGILTGRTASFRERLFPRPADYSAVAPIVSATTATIDHVRLPAKLARRMLAPVIAERLVQQRHSPDLDAARRAVRENTPAARDALRASCAGLTVLLDVQDSPWPLFAAHTELTPEQSVECHPTLLEHLGEQILGNPVRIFPLLTPDAAAQARVTVLPSVLLGDPTARADASLEPPTVLDLEPAELPEQIVQWMRTGETVPLSDLDRFLLFHR